MAASKRPRNAVPAFVRTALREAGLSRRYQLRPAYQRNDYIGWITRGKLAQTRTRRLQQMLDELRKGDVYMKMRWKPRQGKQAFRR
ncbi:MAG TPA: YdeI/OmpD-associated family protein [Anaerolineales bacterium]